MDVSILFYSGSDKPALKGIEKKFIEPDELVSFKNFTQKIPATTVSFDMVAIPGGEFTIGSPPDEPYRNEDEGPVRKVQISPFFIGRLEVTWEEYITFYHETSYKGRQDNISLIDSGVVDAITGPTPPWGAVDQGWGMGQGLENMLGNVYEFCADWYAADTYSMYPADLVVVDPLGPASGTERVIRGGSFNSAPGQVRAASCNHNRHDAWQISDPQIPKSIWWYTDSNEVGFRVVLELELGN